MLILVPKHEIVLRHVPPKNACSLYLLVTPLSHSLKDFKEFANAIDAVKDKGVSVAVASPDDVEAAQKERSNFFEVKKAL